MLCRCSFVGPQSSSAKCQCWGRCTKGNGALTRPPPSLREWGWGAGKQQNEVYTFASNLVICISPVLMFAFLCLLNIETQFPKNQLIFEDIVNKGLVVKFTVQYLLGFRLQSMLLPYLDTHHLLKSHHGRNIGKYISLGQEDNNSQRSFICFPLW